MSGGAARLILAMCAFGFVVVALTWHRLPRHDEAADRRRVLDELERKGRRR